MVNDSTPVDASPNGSLVNNEYVSRVKQFENVYTRKRKRNVGTVASLKSSTTSFDENCGSEDNKFLETASDGKYVGPTTKHFIATPPRRPTTGRLVELPLCSRVRSKNLVVLPPLTMVRAENLVVLPPLTMNSNWSYECQTQVPPPLFGNNSGAGLRISAMGPQVALHHKTTTLMETKVLNA
nr:hypothetical protein [Tanacetum cinerariifolium]